MTPLNKTVKQITPQRNLINFQEWATNMVATPPMNRKQLTPLTQKAITTKTKQKLPSPTPTKTTTKTKKTATNLTFANNPDYEYDAVNNRWVKKSDLRPIELVNRYKTFLIDYLKKNTTMDHKEIARLVRKHATSTNRLKEILVEKGAMTKRKADFFFKKNSFWKKELCEHMKKICPTDTDLKGTDWCGYIEDAFCYFKDITNKKNISCYSIDDIRNIISSSFTGGDEDAIFLQLPRDPYTRKVFSEEFIKTFLKHLRVGKERLNNLIRPHVVYFLRNYKKFYADPKIKPFFNKNTLTKQEKWKLSEAIEGFLTETAEIEHGWAEGHKRWWFWVDEENEPTSMYNYIFKK